ncbi:MAG: lipopolysaccharide kinase InaA family protein [Phycisphaerales bacterium]|nr:lipopolysaccharide kinase InaA family protein [Phycisphaerales bacterium]
MPDRLTILKPGMQSTLESGGFRVYEDYVSTMKGDVVSRSGTTETRRLVLNETVPACSLFLKIYRYQGRNRRSFLRRDKCRLEARNYQILRGHCRVNVPDVIAHGCRRARCRLVDAFILTRGVPNAVPMSEYFTRRWQAPGPVPDDPLRKYLLTETASMLARMHSAGFFHIDLQWRNLLVSDDGSSRPSIFVIDSARGELRKWPVHQAHGRLRDLSSLFKEARFHLTRCELFRWFRQYLGVPKLSDEHKAMIRTIQQDRLLKDEGNGKATKRPDIET